MSWATILQYIPRYLVYFLFNIYFFGRCPLATSSNDDFMTIFSVRWAWGQPLFALPLAEFLFILFFLLYILIWKFGSFAGHRQKQIWFLFHFISFFFFCRKYFFVRTHFVNFIVLWVRVNERECCSLCVLFIIYLFFLCAVGIVTTLKPTWNTAAQNCSRGSIYRCPAPWLRC